MTSRKAWIAGLLGVAAFASTPIVEAQVTLPGAGGATIPVPAAAAPAAVGAAPAAAQPTTLFGFLGLSKANLAACKAKLCASQLGQLLNGMTVPASAFTGGIVPLLCPPVPTAAQLAAMQAGGANGAQATAAKIMQDEADAKARVAAVEYLGTVDCRYWPDALAALINALRFDRNECVRYAAARALNSGCCCDKKVIESLRICVSGGEEDGAAAEASPRVRAAAFAALQNCLAKVPEVIPPEEQPPDRIKPDTNPSLSPGLKPIVPDRAAMVANDPANVAAGYVTQEPRAALSPAEEALRRKTFSQTVDDARRTMFELSQNTRPAIVLPPGKQSVFHALSKAKQDTDITARRKASAQGVQPPTSMPASSHGHSADGAMIDHAVNPTSYVVPATPSRVMPLAETPADRAGSKAANDTQNSINKRGLIGYFVKPKAQAANSQE